MKRMMRKRWVPVAVVMLAWGWSAGPARAQTQAGGEDPVAEAFFPPELLILAYGQGWVTLTDAQKEEMQGEVQKTQGQMDQLQQQLRKEKDVLVGLIAKDQVDEKLALAQADKIMGIETAAKQNQLKLLIYLKNKLTPEQKARLKELKGKIKGFEAKLKKAVQLAEKCQAEGRDLSALQGAKQEYYELMKQGKYPEAEALLDKTIQLLSAKETLPPAANQAPSAPASRPVSIREKVQAKLQQAQQLAEQWRAEGRDLSAVQGSKDEFEVLIREGKDAEAEALVDKVIKTLRDKDANPAPTTNPPPPGPPAISVPEAVLVCC